MQWRMLARRCPSGSMTLVGDFGQASRPGALGDWDEVLAQLPDRADPPRVVHAHGQLPHARRDHGSRPPRARGRCARHRADPRRAHTGEPPAFVTAVGRAGPRRRGRRRGARRSLGEGGTVAVIAPRRCTARSSTRSPTSVPSPTRPSRSTHRSPCSTRWEAKGLEFDHVIVVEPASS